MGGVLDPGLGTLKCRRSGATENRCLGAGTLVLRLGSGSPSTGTGSDSLELDSEAGFLSVSSLILKD